MLGFGVKRRSLFATLSTLIVLFFIAACGGGGGGGGNNNTSNNGALTGDYRAGVIGFDSVGGWTDLVDVTFDGSGQFSGTSASSGAVSGSYTVQSDGVWTADNETGQLSQDGAIFHLVNTDPSDLSLSIGFKKSSGMSVADLSGTYHTFAFLLRNTYDFSVARFSFTFDGAGSFSYFGISVVNLGGGSYTVDDAGLFNLDLGGEGQVSANGDIFFFIMNDSLTIGIRQSSGMTNADLTGTFHAVALTEDDTNDDDPGTLSAGRGNISPDGSGNVTITPIDPPDSPSTGTGTVNGDGTITGADPNTGQLSPDSGFFILADDGTVDPDNDYEMIIGILKP